MDYYRSIAMNLEARLIAREDQIKRLESALDEQDGYLDRLKAVLVVTEDINEKLCDKIRKQDQLRTYNKLRDM